jgi:hypothetical protein
MRPASRDHSIVMQPWPAEEAPDPDGADAAALDPDSAWDRLRPLGVHAVAHLVEAYRLARTWEGRAAAVSLATRFARDSELAFQLGLEALDDRSKRVRGRACGLLAYSLRKDAVARLRTLTGHADRETRDDAEAALAAIRDQNHHLFKDRDESGLVFWILDVRDLPDP